MISIEFDSGDMDGACIMRVVMGDEEICRFEYHNQDSLTVCMRKAADAVELSQWAEKVLRDDSKGG
ncbi:MAG: hypothetical protein P8X39_02990 [Desulfofustis sp.]|jgi:hypothetical protein